jgi:hypothetical protein
MMRKEFSCHLIKRRMLFALGSKHKAFLLRRTAAHRSSSLRLISGRRADLRHHIGRNQMRNNWLS